MNEPQMHFLLVKVARYKNYILHDFILFHFGKGNCRDRKKISDVQRLGMERGGKYEGHERIFLGDDCLHLLKLRTVHKKGQNVLYVNYNSVNLTHTQKGNKEP